MLKVNTKELINALKKVKSLMKGNVFSFMRFTTKGDDLFINALSTGLYISVKIPCESDEDTEFILNADDIVRCINPLKGETTSIIKEEKTIVIRNNKLRLEIPKISTKWTKLEPLENGSTFTVDSDYLKSLITRVQFAANGNDMQSQINFNVSNDTIMVTALDGKRIAIVGEEKKDSKAFSIPAVVLKTIVNYLEGTVYIKNNGEKFMIYDKTFMVIGQKMNKAFFDPEPILSKKPETSFTVKKDEMMNSLSVAQSLNSNFITFSIEAGDKMKIDAQSTFGSMSEEIFCNTDLSKFKMTFNPGYLIDVLKVIPDEDVQFFCSAEESAFNVGVFIMSDDYKYVVARILRK